jgi:hypothetical protein
MQPLRSKWFVLAALMGTGGSVEPRFTADNYWSSTRAFLARKRSVRSKGRRTR